LLTAVVSDPSLEDLEAEALRAKAKIALDEERREGELESGFPSTDSGGISSEEIRAYEPELASLEAINIESLS